MQIFIVKEVHFAFFLFQLRPGLVSPIQIGFTIQFELNVPFVQILVLEYLSLLSSPCHLVSFEEFVFQVFPLPIGFQDPTSLQILLRVALVRKHLFSSSLGPLFAQI
jgi:hypothetical protein